MPRSSFNDGPLAETLRRGRESRHYQFHEVKLSSAFFSRPEMVPVIPDRFIIPKKVWDTLGRNHRSHIFVSRTSA